MVHKCSYCKEKSKLKRDELVDIGWSFLDCRAPIRTTFKSCPLHFDDLKKDISKCLNGTMQTKWSSD